MLRTIFNFTLIASTLRLATPLILAALGGLYCERSGVINIALEGIMLAGAFTAALVTYYAQNPWVGILAAVMWVTGEAPAALVILPPADMLDHLPAGTALVSIGPYSVTLRGGSDLVGMLYRAGALLVLPAGLTGCLPQDPRESQRVG